jgi:hypothetical protein
MSDEKERRARDDVSKLSILLFLRISIHFMLKSYAFPICDHLRNLRQVFIFQSWSMTRCPDYPMGAPYPPASTQFHPDSPNTPRNRQRVTTPKCRNPASAGFKSSTWHRYSCLCLFLDRRRPRLRKHRACPELAERPSTAQTKYESILALLLFTTTEKSATLCLTRDETENRRLSRVRITALGWYLAATIELMIPIAIVS